MSRCHDCDAQLLFVTLDTGRPIPVDPIPTERGNVAAIRNEQGHLVGYVIARDKPLRAEYGTYMPHKANCKPVDKPVSVKDRPASLFDPDPNDEEPPF